MVFCPCSSAPAVLTASLAAGLVGVRVRGSFGGHRLRVGHGN